MTDLLPFRQVLVGKSANRDRKGEGELTKTFYIFYDSYWFLILIIYAVKIETIM